MQHIPSAQQSSDTLRAGRSEQGAILYAPPQRAYTFIGIVSANRYKLGWTDPTVRDAIPQLQAAGAQIGADAVIVRSHRSNNNWHVVVEGDVRSAYTENHNKT